jgi:glycosyltransferase involved in cell wall biosynthesis
MNLTFLLPNDKSGGGNRVFVELAKEHLKKDVNNSSTIIFFKKSESRMHYLDSDSNINCIYYESKFKNIVFKYLSFYFFLRKYNNYDKLIFSDPFLSIMLIFFPKNKINNIIRYIQSDDYNMYDDLYILKNKFYLYIYKVFCYFSFKVNCTYLFNSIYTYECFLRKNKNYNTNKNIVRPGYDPKVFYSDNSNKTLNIGIIARKHPWKGFDDFINAYKILSIEKKKLINNIYIISNEIFTFEHFTDKKILFLNPSNDFEISNIMRKCGVFISTSWFEGYGLPQLESIACGCLLLTSNSKGINEFSVNGENCIHYISKDFMDLNSKLCDIITNYEVYKKRFNQVSTSVNKFTWENTYKEFIQHLKIQQK